jgi:hypothetical protein
MRYATPRAVSFAALFLLGAAALPADSAGPVSATADAARLRGPAEPGVHMVEQRYRVMGKLRLVLFWAGRDNVGTARMTSRSDGSTQTLTFLIGSEPQRAPRNLNEWSYLREEVQSARADVFALKSLEETEDGTKLPEVISEDQIFGVSCTSLTDGAARSIRTTVNARGVTYRMFERLLDRIATSARWQEHSLARPPGAAAGFLTAMQHVMQMGRTDPGSLASFRPITYVYDNAVYDLWIRGSNRLGRTKVGVRWFDRLIRTDFSIRNRKTGDVTRFSTTYSQDDAAPALPVQIFFQPSFWLRIELRLDDEADVPEDPAADGAVLNRIRAICAPARQ